MTRNTQGSSTVDWRDGEQLGTILMRNAQRVERSSFKKEDMCNTYYARRIRQINTMSFRTLRIIKKPIFHNPPNTFNFLTLYSHCAIHRSHIGVIIKMKLTENETTFLAFFTYFKILIIVFIFCLIKIKRNRSRWLHGDVITWYLMAGDLADCPTGSPGSQHDVAVFEWWIAWNFRIS